MSNEIRPQFEVLVNNLINNINNVTQENTNDVTSKINEIIEKLEMNKIPDEKQFKVLFGRLNFKVKLLKQTGAKNQDIDERMDQLAIAHHIKRYDPIKKKFPPIVNKMRKMMSARGGKILSEKQWKEFFDKWHRSGKVLDKAFTDWKVYHSQNMSFEDYLNSEEAREFISEKQKGPASGVSYLNERERLEHQCTLRMENGKIVCRKSNNHSVMPDGTYIAVLGPDQQFYLGKKQKGRFQHSSFFGGKSVHAAGKFEIENGVVQEYASKSGHYRPTKTELFKALKHMEKIGLDISKIKVMYKEHGKKVKIKNPKEWDLYQSYLIHGILPNYRPLIPDANLDAKMRGRMQIDIEAAKLAQASFGGGQLDPILDAVLPVNSNETHLEWVHKKNQVARLIGKLPPPVPSDQWRNSSTTIVEMMHDIHRLAPIFKETSLRIAEETNSSVNFGPNDKNMIKNEESLTRKVQQDSKLLEISEEDALSKIGDALRGTIVTDDPRNIKQIVDKISTYVERNGGKITFKNLWAEERESGYVGVHAKLLLPIPSEEGETKYVMAEMQIHLNAIMDGTKECVKEREHLIYEHVRTGFDPLQASAGSKLLYLAALNKVLKPVVH